MLTSAFTVRVNLIGAELRRHREAAGLTLAEVQKRLGLHPTLLNRMELGGRPQSSEDVAGLLAIYGVMGEERRQLLDLTHETERTVLLQRHSASLKERMAALKVLESRAIRMINFECQLIPGLLQTFPYAQAVIRNVGMVSDQRAIDERASTRIQRQGVLRRPGGPELLAIVTESVLHNLIGDTAIMREQLRYLTEAVERPNIKLRVIPASSGNHPGFDGPFIRMQFRTRRGVVMLSNRTSSLYLEDDEDLEVHNLVVVELLSVALNEEDSVAFIHEVAQEQF